jgi:hypothetical protein
MYMDFDAAGTVTLVSSTYTPSDSVEQPVEGSQTFAIPSENYGRLCERVAKLERRAQRRGFADVGLVTYGRTVNTMSDGRVTTTYTVGVFGEAPAYHGWQFVATLEHLGEDGNIVRSVPNAAITDGELARFRSGAPLCDHCKLRRNRIDTFVVKELATGVLKQVGRNCLADFLGGQSPEVLAGRAQWLVDLEALCSGESFGGGGTSDSYTVESFLRVVYAVVKCAGWVSRGQAREDYRRTATADIAIHQPQSGCKTETGYKCDYCQLLHSDYRRFYDDAASMERVTAAVAWVESLEAQRDSLNDYLHNLYVAMRSGVMTDRQAGIVASVFAAHDKAMGIERERQARPVSRAHLGTIGKRQGFRLTVERQREIEGAYGVTTVFSFRDADGNAAVWFASGSWSDMAGETWDIKATVKDHGMYNNEPQTVLTRGKFDKEVA